MNIINSRTDIQTYIQNARPDVVTHGLTEALVDVIRDADHPAYGDDWSEWLDAVVDTFVAAVAS